MTIERFENLKEISQQIIYNFEQGHHMGLNFNDKDYFDLAYGLQSLITAEIERQNVVEEDAEQVEDISQDISWYLNEYVHRDCDYQVYSAMCDLFSELEKITLNALKAYREEPCAVCSDGELTFNRHKGNDDWDRFVPCVRCPICGRKLQEES